MVYQGPFRPMGFPRDTHVPELGCFQKALVPGQETSRFHQPQSRSTTGPLDLEWASVLHGQQTLSRPMEDA
jgi:hypothetical protein